MPAAFATVDLSNAATMAVSTSPGMTCTSETGVFLTEVPEPATAVQLATGVLALFGLGRAAGPRRSELV